MKISLEINQKGDCPLSLAKLQAVVLASLKLSRLPIKKKEVSLSVAFVTPAQIRKINRQYRRKDKVTDVLSFGEYASSQELLKDKEASVFLGEIILCCSDIKKSAKMNELSFRNEFIYVFSHGVLHLLGFDHGEEMFAIQDEVVLKIK